MAFRCFSVSSSSLPLTHVPPFFFLHCHSFHSQQTVDHFHLLYYSLYHHSLTPFTTTLRHPWLHNSPISPLPHTSPPPPPQLPLPSLLVTPDSTTPLFLPLSHHPLLHPTTPSPAPWWTPWCRKSQAWPPYRSLPLRRPTGLCEFSTLCVLLSVFFMSGAAFYSITLHFIIVIFSCVGFFMLALKFFDVLFFLPFPKTLLSIFACLCKTGFRNY